MAANSHQPNRSAICPTTPLATPRFNPSTPSFQPSTTIKSNEIQAYHPPSPTSSAHYHHQPPDLWPLANHLLRLENTVASDIRNLQEQIWDMQQLQLRDHDEEQGQRDSEASAMRVRRGGMGVLELELPPPEAMVPRFGQNVVARVYAEQAEVLESVVGTLKGWVTELIGEGENGAVNMIRGKGHNGEVGESGGEVETTTTMTIAADAVVKEDRGTTSSKEEESVVNKDIFQNAPPSNITKTTSQAPNASSGEKEDREPVKKSAVSDSKINTWIPLGVRLMPPTPCPRELETYYPETFPLPFLSNLLNGDLWSPGYFFIPHSRHTILPSRAYWLLDAAVEPYIPRHPGQHGAKLTAFFNATASNPGEAPEVGNYMDTPVFVKEVGKEEWRYFGQYSQLRFSDRLDFDRVQEAVPKEVRNWWAMSLGEKGKRPGWVEGELMRAFWPRPVYDGPVPGDEGEEEGEEEEVWKGKVERALWAYAEELRDWERDARIKVSHLRETNLEHAFSAADADEEPGLRLWWEYLQCVGFDEGFYDMLVRLKGLEEWREKEMKGTAGVKGVFGEKSMPAEKSMLAEKEMLGDNGVITSNGTPGSEQKTHQTVSGKAAIPGSAHANAMEMPHATPPPPTGPRYSLPPLRALARSSQSRTPGGSDRGRRNQRWSTRQ